jgi:hypothetical protein
MMGFCYMYGSNFVQRQGLAVFCRDNLFMLLPFTDCLAPVIKLSCNERRYHSGERSIMKCNTHGLHREHFPPITNVAHEALQSAASFGACSTTQLTGSHWLPDWYPEMRFAGTHGCP